MGMTKTERQAEAKWLQDKCRCGHVRHDHWMQEDDCDECECQSFKGRRS